MKKYYLIDYPFGNHGFFAHLNFALGQLDYAYQNNLIPVIDWSQSQFSENNENLFDVIFDSKFKIEDVNETNSVLCPREFLFFVKGQEYSWPVGYPPRCEKVFRIKEVVSNLHFLFNYYFDVKEEITKSIPPEITQYKTLGVHCRRSDMKYFHPENVSVVKNVDFYERTMKVFNEHKFDKIYLATEEQDILDYFLTRLGDKIIYSQCKRIQPGESNFWTDVDSDGNKIAKEVIIDSICLSKCDSLLTGISGVTYGSIFFNGLKYTDVYYFDEI